MHRAAGDVAPKAKRAWFVGDKSQGRGLTRISLNRDVITINVKSMNYIGADELNRHVVALIHSKLRGRIGKLTVGENDWLYRAI